MLTTKPKLSIASFINENDFLSISEFMNHPQFKNPVDANDRKRVIRNTLETMYRRAKNPNETRGRKKKVDAVVKEESEPGKKEDKEINV